MITILTYPQKFKIIEAVKIHFSQPDVELAKGARNECYYRKGEEADSATRCMIGIFIPDEKYHPHMEGGNFGNLVREDVDFSTLENFGAYIIDEEDISWLSCLQKVHDRAESVRDLLLRLQGFALGSGIQYGMDGHIEG